MASTALDYITIKGFKSIREIDKLPLRPINVVIGANGSGKSNFIGAFAFLHAIRAGRLTGYVTAAGGAERLLHFGSKNTKEMSFQLSFNGGRNQYGLKLSPTADDGLYPSEEFVSFWDKNQHEAPYDERLAPRNQGREAGISDQRPERIAAWVRK